MFNYPIGSGGKPEAKAKKPEMTATMEPGEGEPEDGAAIAEEHGPASDVHISHEMGHKVTSEHPDGHHHESDHESAEAAHEHGKKLAGVGAEPAEDDWK